MIIGGCIPGTTSICLYKTSDNGASLDEAWLCDEKGTVPIRPTVHGPTHMKRLRQDVPPA